MSAALELQLIGPTRTTACRFLNTFYSEFACLREMTL